MNQPRINPMKAFFSVSTALLVAVAGITGCSKETKTKADTTTATTQDTMLLRDLAEANRNTATAAAADNSLGTVRMAGDTVLLSGQRPTNVTNGSASVGEVSPSPTPRLTPPLRANDAPRPTTVPVSRSPASSVATRASRDPCDSPTLTDQRYCLNRSIAENDADLNRTYQELIAQARKSGGADLEERFRQSQREWVNQRDADCSSQTETRDGKLWARTVGRCLANYSSRRTAELSRSLSSLRGQ
jgi:uncharacterized protein YecT (DUF1311 family)